MTTLSAPARPAKPGRRRTFAEGLLDAPGPAPDLDAVRDTEMRPGPAPGLICPRGGRPLYRLPSGGLTTDLPTPGEPWNPALLYTAAGAPDVILEAEAAAGEAPTEPEDWPAWTDADAWEPGPGPGPEAEAEAGGLLGLGAWIARQAGRYRLLETDAADLIAEALAGLAGRVRLVGAETPAQARDRLEAEDDRAHGFAFARGFDEGYELARRELN